MTLQEICNIIILVGAVTLAVTNIYKFFKKPVDSIEAKSTEKERKRIEAILEEKMPAIMEEHDERIRTKLQAEIEEIGDTLAEIKKINLSQEKDLKDIQTKANLINSAQMDVMRYNMNNIYYKYRPYKRILDCDKKAFIKFYNDYHSMGGNTWIDALYQEVITWEIIEDEKELKVE